jgi:hypothetical protein
MSDTVIKRLKTGLIVLAFSGLVLAGVLLNINNPFIIFGNQVNPRAAGLYLIAISVVIYLTGRVLSTFIKYKRPHDDL